MNESPKIKSFFWPVVLVLVGAFLLMINAGFIKGTMTDNLILYWPVILVLLGMDGIWRHDGRVFPLVLIGLGAVFLMGNLNILHTKTLPLLARIWPILLVAIGLDIFLVSLSKRK